MEVQRTRLSFSTSPKIGIANDYSYMVHVWKNFDQVWSICLNLSGHRASAMVELVDAVEKLAVTSASIMTADISIQD